MSQSSKRVLLHLGLGSFHRAHQAVYMQALREQGDYTWALAGGNIRDDMSEVITALIDQKGEYTLETVTPQGERSYQRIKSIERVIAWDAQLAGLTSVVIEPTTRIISFTVTEAGYYLDSEDKLDLSYTDLVTDLNGESHRTLYGALARLLEARRLAEAGPITLMNCDNLRSNGSRFRLGFEQFLLLRDQTVLLDWVRCNTTTPNSMVDRITPRPTPDVIERVTKSTGTDDKAAVMAEAFTQWVLEDDFIAGRPCWERVGIEMVEDVMPYEEAKIRLLNATHSCIAWAGTLVGYTYIHEGSLDDEIRQMAYDYVSNDVIPLLHPSPLDLEAYRDIVLERFSNPSIQDTNARVAMDGFSKIPGFILPTIKESLERDRSIDSVAMLPALFLEFLMREHRGENPFPYQDQLMDPNFLTTLANTTDPVDLFCNERLLFNDLAGNGKLIEAMRKAMKRVQLFVSKRAKQVRIS